VYPVLAFIVAFLPTLMVEIGFTTVFEPEKLRPAHRLGFLGRHMHWLYIRAGRQKILRAERMAKEASTKIAARDQALAAAIAASDTALVEKEAELQAAREAVGAAAAKYDEQLKRKEEEFVAKLAATTDSLNRTVVEKDALRDLQKSEIERQIQMRQNAWSDRLTQLRQELDDQRAASETERMAVMQEHHKKLMEVSEDCKTQVVQARRQAADAELAAMEASARLSHDLKEALNARDAAEAQLQQQAESFSVKLTQAKEEAGRELEKVNRQEKHRFDRQQLEFGKTLRQHEDDFEHKLKLREQELTLSFDARLVEEQTRIEQDARRREAELERQFDARAREVDARWKQEVQQREDAAQTRLRQREQQLHAQAETRVNEMQTQFEQELRRRGAELEHHLEVQSREADTHLKQELQQREVTFQAKLKQRELDLTAQLTAQAEARQIAAQAQWEKEAEKKTRVAIEPFEALVARAEKERDEAKQYAAEGARQVQNLEKQLTEASSFLNGWRNGKNNLVGAA
jgi:hypothetical protein